MYELGVQKNFIAQHFLMGGDFGSENNPHSHAYRLEVICSARKTDQHNYLIDIVDLKNAINEVVNKFSDQLLNNLPEFNQTNPSIEHFAQILYILLKPSLIRLKADIFKVKLWEDDSSWAAYHEDVLITNNEQHNTDLFFQSAQEKDKNPVVHQMQLDA